MMTLRHKHNVIISLTLVLCLLFVACLSPIEASAAVGEALALLTGGTGLYAGLSVAAVAALLVLACKNTSYQLTNRMRFVNWLASMLSHGSVEALNTAASAADSNVVEVPSSVVSEVSSIVESNTTFDANADMYKVAYKTVGLVSTIPWVAGSPSITKLAELTSTQLGYLAPFPAGWSYYWTNTGTTMVLHFHNSYTNFDSTETFETSSTLGTSLTQLGLTTEEKVAFLNEHVTPFLYTISKSQNATLGDYAACGTIFVDDQNRYIGFASQMLYSNTGSYSGNGRPVVLNTEYSNSLPVVKVNYPFAMQGADYDVSYIPTPLTATGAVSVTVPSNLTEDIDGVISWVPSVVNSISDVANPDPSPGGDDDEHHTLRDFITSGLAFLASFPEKLGDLLDAFGDWFENSFSGLAGVISAFGIYFRTFFAALPASFTVPVTGFLILTLFVFVFRKIRGTD